ncbi:MAG: heavy metal translocating P-type ATPase [Brucellaceae bacterium]|nr:heavy metal translocating P-type ATPase [Brucellaceae bacterium]
MAVDQALRTCGVDDTQRIEEILRAADVHKDGSVQYTLSVPSIHCGQCIQAIERALNAMDGIVQARVNMTLKRVTVVTRDQSLSPADIISTLDRLGYYATAADIGDNGEGVTRKASEKLLKAMAVAGFAAGNIMLLSVSVWSGAEGATRDLFHLVSGMIAIPVVAYSGRVFFGSALKALSAGRLNMDVPISLAVVLALAMSLYESLTGGAEAYFDASVTLLFFLLIGRYLDQLMRERARSAVLGLARMSARGAMSVETDGSTVYVPIDEVGEGMVVRVAPGERIPADGTVLRGESDLDRSLVTGESAPVSVAPATVVEAGTMNLTGPLDITVTRKANESFIAEVMQMMQAAENGRGRYVRIADRMARIYAPAVHLLALFAFVGWMIATGGDWHSSLYTAISVLIITCPCALGLAVPVVHVIGANRLFRNGVLMKDGSALERLAEADRAVFDKTGTLTTGSPAVAATTVSDRDAPLAKALAARSIHPASRAIAAYLADYSEAEIDAIREVPGHGVEGRKAGRLVRLGRRDWVAEIAGKTADDDHASDALAFAREGGALGGFRLLETLREGAAEAVWGLKAAGLGVELISGDAAPAVRRIADAVGIADAVAGATPASKIERVQALQHEGPQGADGRRRAERRTGAGGGRRLHGACLGVGYRAHGGRFRLPARHDGIGSLRASVAP